MACGLPSSLDFSSQRAAITGSCGTPSPFAASRPSINAALACPCSAACRYHSLAGRGRAPHLPQFEGRFRVAGAGRLFEQTQRFCAAFRPGLVNQRQFALGDGHVLAGPTAHLALGLVVARLARVHGNGFDFRRRGWRRCLASGQDGGQHDGGEGECVFHRDHLSSKRAGTAAVPAHGPYLLRSMRYLAKPLASSPPSAATLAMPLPCASARWPGAERRITGPAVAVLTKLQLRALPLLARVTLPPLVLSDAR